MRLIRIRSRYGEKNSINNSTGSLTINPASGDSTVNYSIGGVTKFNVEVIDADDSFRINDGVNDFLIIESTGEVTKPLQPCSGALKSATSNNVTGDGSTYTMISNTEIWDLGSNYNSGTGVFLAPVAGKYFISARYYSEGGWATSIEVAELRIVTSNRFVEGWGYNNTTNTGVFTHIGSPDVFGIVDMDALDTAYITIRGAGGAKSVDIYGAAGQINTGMMVTLLV